MNAQIWPRRWLVAAAELANWESFTEKAASDGVPDASLWACLIRNVTTQETTAEGPRALVSTRRFADGFAALQAFCPRWHIEDEAYRLQAGERLAVMPIRRL